MFSVSNHSQPPVERLASANDVPLPPQGASSDGRTLVLLVDDNSMTRVLLATRLREAGFAVETATIARTTADRAAKIRPDAVVINLNQHEKAGFELVRDIRRNRPENSMPIFALADAQFGRVENRAERLGLTRVFQTSGGRPQELIKAMTEWFAPQRASVPPQDHAPAPASAPPAVSPPPVARTVSLVRHGRPVAIEPLVAGVRQEWETFARCVPPADSSEALKALLKAVGLVLAATAGGGEPCLKLLCRVMAGLLGELVATPSAVTSTIRKTLAEAVEFLQTLGAAKLPPATGAALELKAVIIESQSTQCVLLRTVLETCGYVVRQFEQPVGALPWLETSPTDLIVINVAAPQIRGYDAITTLRAMPRVAATPLLVITLPNDVDGAAHLVSQGAGDVVTEPLLPTEFVVKAVLLSLKRRLADGMPETPTVTAAGIAAPCVAPALAERPPPTTEIPEGPDPKIAKPAEIPRAIDPDAEAMLTFDEHWTIASASEAGAAVLNCAASMLAGRNLRDWVILGLSDAPEDAFGEKFLASNPGDAGTLAVVVRCGDASIHPARLCLKKQGNRQAPRWTGTLTLDAASGQNESSNPAAPLADREESKAPITAAETKMKDREQGLSLREIDELLTITTNDEPPTASDTISLAGELATVAPATDPEPTSQSSNGTMVIGASEVADESAIATTAPEAQFVSATNVDPAIEPETPSPAAAVAAPSSSTTDLPARLETNTMTPISETAPGVPANCGPSVGVDASLNAEVADLRRSRDKLAEAVADLEARLREKVAAQAAAVAQAQREQSERRRQEQRAAGLSKRLEELHEDIKQHLKAETSTSERLAALEQELAQRDESAAQLRADLEREMADKQALAQELTSLSGVNDVLRQEISHLETTASEFGALQQDLENRLRTSAAASAEATEKAARESADRVHLETQLARAREAAGAEARQHAAELARIRAALQAETLHRRRLESEAIQSRCRISEAERARASASSRFQQHLRGPVFSLVQSVGRLLEQDLSPAQREIAEGVLSNAALVQTSLADLSSGGSARGPETTAADAASATGCSTGGTGDVAEPGAERPARAA